MAVLHVHLQDGFVGEPIVLRLNDRTVAQRDRVRTRPQLGLAEQLDVEAPDGPATLTIELPSRARSRSFALDLTRPLHVGISVEPDGSVSHRILEHPIGYV